MKITSNTKYADFEYAELFIDDSERVKITQAAEQYFKPCSMLTLNEFIGLAEGNYELLGDLSDPSVLQVYWLKKYEAFCKEVRDLCTRLQIEPTEEQKRAQNGCLTTTPTENMLIFTRSYFGLPSFFAAGERTIGEYLTARKDEYNKARYNRNWDAIQAAKFKKK